MTLLPGTADLEIPILHAWTAGTSRILTRRGFWALVAAYVALIEQHPTDGGISIVLSRTSPEQMALFIACVAAGRLAAMFPPGPALQDEAAFFIQQRGALTRISPERIFIFSEAVLDVLTRIDPALGARSILVPDHARSADGAAIQRARDSFARALQSEAPIFVQHSSGTTGIKKAVPITGAALLAQYRAYWPMLRLATQPDGLRIASWLPLYHDMGLLTSLLLPVIGEDFVSILDPQEWIGDPGLFLRMIEQDRCTLAWMPNFAYRHFVRLRPALPGCRLHSMRLWIDCSEPCRMADASAFEAAFADQGVRPASVLGCYAMAETVFAATMCPVGEQRAIVVPGAVAPGDRLAADAVSTDGGRLVLSSGRALPGLEVAVLVDGHAAPAATYGEVGLRGPFVFGGYGGMGPAQSGIGQDGFFRTGDLGVLMDGHLFVFGRLKEVIIVRGRNLFAGDIEDAIGSVAGVKPGRAVAFGLESAQTGSEELIVIAEADTHSAVPAAQARQAINRLIADLFMVTPRDIRIVEERWLIKSTSGKLSRSENATKYLIGFGQARPGRDSLG